MDYVPKGIGNLGNTCYMNVMLQILSQCPELNKRMTDTTNVNESIMEYGIHQNWKDICKLLHHENTKGRVVPRGFLQWFYKVAKHRNNDIFESYYQCDAVEFLQFFIDCLHETFKRSIDITIEGDITNDVDKIALQCYKYVQQCYKDDYSELKDLFYGIMVSTIVSQQDQSIHSVTPDIYFTLDLPIAMGEEAVYTDLYDCLDAFVKPEVMEGENAWYNDKTQQKEDVTKEIQFWNFPKILIVSLKRYSMDGSSKCTHKVSFPLELDLVKYSVGYHRNENVFELFGVGNHFGNLQRGHYTNFVKSMNGKWYYCDDESVHELTSTNVIETEHAYCLFYRKKNNPV